MAAQSLSKKQTPRHHSDMRPDIPRKPSNRTSPGPQCDVSCAQKKAKITAETAAEIRQRHTPSAGTVGYRYRYAVHPGPLSPPRVSRAASRAVSPVDGRTHATVSGGVSRQGFSPFSFIHSSSFHTPSSTLRDGVSRYPLRLLKVDRDGRRQHAVAQTRTLMGVAVTSCFFRTFHSFFSFPRRPFLSRACQRTGGIACSRPCKGGLCVRL